MKITYHWMREFTPLDISAAELAKRLTFVGLEVESVSPAAPAFSGVVVGQVIEAGRHPDAEKLSLCQVTTDGTNRLQIICGAPNVRAGLKVAVAMIGAVLPGDVHIKRAKLRGLESQGMLCSARELGLGVEHDGIMELPEMLALGRDLRDALDLDDTSFEVNATPNRGDCMSVFGIARDYTAAHARRYLEYAATPVTPVNTSRFPVSLDGQTACPVFASRVIRGVTAGVSSPAWLRERLRRVGINSISPIVDVTNYVMIEIGQPMHAYDLNRLNGRIIVRSALAGEKIVLLDDREYALDPDFTVVADDSGPIGLAGIMGGRSTAIAAETTEVLLEAAHFVPDAVAGRARRLGLFTDAGQRFERGVDPSLPMHALERATALLTGILGGEPGPVEVTRAAETLAGDAANGAPPWVGLRRRRLSGLLGVEVPDSEVHSILSSISARVLVVAGGWRVTKPPHRFDIRIEVDLIEEVARLRGFDSIVERHAVGPQIAGYATEALIPQARLFDALVDRGYHEAITYSFVDPTLQRQLFPDTPSLALANPISLDLSEMRVSLWTGLIRALRDNVRRQQARVRLFEIGKKFENGAAGLREIETLAGIATGARLPEQWGATKEPLDFYDVKADLLNILALAGEVDDVRFETGALGCLHPGRCARIVRNGAALGWLGELHPQLAKAFGFTSPVYLFELETNLAFSSKSSYFKQISKFPSVRRDLAIVVDEGVPLAALQENVTVSAAGFLSELRIFDIYRGPGVETGRKSIALGLILQDSSRTLTDVDADSVVTAVVARLRDTLSATIRDQ